MRHYIREGGKAYLFFGESTTAHTVLNLWIADSPYGEFKPHPMNPVVISPSSRKDGREDNKPQRQDATLWAK